MLSVYAGLGLLLFGAAACAQTSAQAELDEGYKLLSQKDYDAAVQHFRTGLKTEPGNANAHKDLAYTLLKTGDNAEARDQFAEAVTLNRHDDTAALEFAFLAYETGEAVEARRTFDRLRKQGGTAATRATAEQAFQNIDKPLADGITRWKEAIGRSAHPNDLSMFSAHWELAHLAEQRDELQLASDEYQICRQLKPQLGEILLIQARLWRQLNRVEDSKAAVLAASRATNPRTAEQGLEMWGSRYPYAYEFLNAITLDPRNMNLRHELGFLYLAMNKRDEATAVFEQTLEVDPQDETAKKQLDSLTRHAVVTGAAPAMDSRAMGFKSLSLGYARDAIKYLRQAHDDDPDDMEIVLKLGWAYNYAHDDATAIRYFEQARHASDPKVAAEAKRAYNNLTGGVEPQTTMWLLPMYSSRWNDFFSYGQLKHTFPTPLHWISLYVSMRFDGDMKSSIPVGANTPLYLSQSSVVPALGLSTKPWHHITLWAEAGESMNYLPFRHDEGIGVPDYRGGLNYVKGLGHLLGSSSPGPFFETSFDGVYVSRFDKDWIFTSQNRTGWTFGGAQLYWNANNTHDLKNQYWAETFEMGPGFKLHMPWMRPGVYFSTDLLRGVYTNNLDNLRRPNYNDVRVGFWYAFTK